MKGILGFIGERLTESREARGITKSSLANLIGVAPPQITKYENGDQTPSQGTLEKICSVLSMPVDYFFYERERETDSSSAIFYRSISSATKRQRLSAEKKYLWVQDIYSYLWRFIEFPNVNLPEIDVPQSPELISPDFIETVAERLRQHWGVSDSPIENITRLVENNGIVISFYDLEADTLDAFSQYCFDKPHIIVSNQKTASRIRFNIAHEIGHLVLHRNISSKVFNTNEMFKLMEKQAHRFAGAFIFPQTPFFEEILCADLTTFRLRKARWKLSIAAMIYRAKDLKLIDDEGEERLRRSYGRNRWNRNEPLDDEMPIDYPELLKDALELIINEGVQSRSDVLEAIPISISDIENLAGLEPDFLKDKVVKLKLRRLDAIDSDLLDSSAQDVKHNSKVVPIGKYSKN